MELLNFGAFVGFILVNLSVVRHFYLRLRRRSGMALLTNLIFPLTGGRSVFLRLAESEYEGASSRLWPWLALGVIYLAIITRGFRIPPRSLSSLKELV